MTYIGLGPKTSGLVRERLTFEPMGHHPTTVSENPHSDHNYHVLTSDYLQDGFSGVLARNRDQ